MSRSKNGLNLLDVYDLRKDDDGKVYALIDCEACGRRYYEDYTVAVVSHNTELGNRCISCDEDAEESSGVSVTLLGWIVTNL